MFFWVNVSPGRLLSVLETMWRLHPRGGANQGVCVDADGAMLGPDFILVQRTPSGYRAARRGIARDIQRILLSDKDAPDWLYEQGQRIAKALDRGEIALAQIYGLRIPVRDLDHRQLKQLAAIATHTKAGFNPDEPRIPAGQPGGGEWTDDGDDDNGENAAPAQTQYLDQQSDGGTRDVQTDQSSSDAQVVPVGYTVPPSRGGGDQ